MGEQAHPPALGLGHGMLAVQVWPLQRASTRGRRGPERRRPQILFLCDTDALEACWQAPASLTLPLPLSC